MSDRHKATQPQEQEKDYVAPWVMEVPGSMFIYHVSSASNPEYFHTVDLTQRGGRGVCTCENFQFVATANWNRHNLDISYAPGRHGCSECKHIRAANEHALKFVWRPAMAQMAQGICPPKNPEP